MLLSPNHRKRTPPILWAVFAAGIVVIVIGVSVSVVEKDIGVRRSPFFAPPSPTTFTQSTESPTPLPLYMPRTVVLRRSKAQFINSFLQATIGEGDDPEQGDHIFRWEQEIVTARLRGQPTQSDRSCFLEAAGSLNAAMATAKIKTPQTETSADLEVYLLPKEQFTSVDPDAPVDKISALSSLRNGYALLIDRAQSEDTRCYLLRARILQALGFPYLFEPSVLRDIPLEARTPAAGGYSDYELELIRLLYSPYLASGLSRIEVERRLLP